MQIKRTPNCCRPCWLASRIGASAVICGQQVNPVPAYVIAGVNVTDVSTMQKYGRKVPETLASFNGHYHYVVRGGQTQSLEGEPPKGIVVIAFDSAEQAREWYD